MKRIKKLISPRIVGVIGAMGSGKTLFATSLAFKLKDNYKIMTNYEVSFRDDVITPDKMGAFFDRVNKVNDDTLMIIDEFHIFTDSRLSSSRHNILMSYFITQTRKQNIQLIYTTQQFGQVDVRVRDNTDLLAIPNYNPKHDIMTVIYLKRNWFSGQFEFSHYKRFNNLKPIFDTYNTKQLMGDSMLERLKRAEENANKK